MFLVVVVCHGKGFITDSGTDTFTTDQDFGNHPIAKDQWLMLAGRRTGVVKAAIDEILVFSKLGQPYVHFKRFSDEQF
jgi:hypothetical protein